MAVTSANIDEVIKAVEDHEVAIKRLLKTLRTARTQKERLTARQAADNTIDASEVTNIVGSFVSLADATTANSTFTAAKAYFI